MEARDEIKSRLPIEQLVGEYCQLTRKGRNFVCLCPFHNDTRPSLLVSPDKGIAYCFACQTGGDIFNFYQAIEGVDFPQAIKDLAEKAGVTLPKEHLKPGPKKDEKERIRECLNAARSFYMTRLVASNEASSYLMQRDVSAELKKQFGIGYAPDSFNETYDHLLKAGFSKTEIIGAGLAVQKDLDERMHDRFRHRIMFPIEDHQGEMIGFGGRTLRAEDAKYVNSPEGPLYHKSSVLYGLSLAKESIRTSRRVILVEGYFDVIACFKAGIQNVVAVSGTALTEQHAKLLRRYAEHAVLCLDQDRAGRDAATRAFHVLTKQGFGVTLVKLSAKDPDEFAKKEPVLFQQLMKDGGLPYIDQMIEDIKTGDLNTPQNKRDATELLLTLVSSLQTAVEREAYLEKISLGIGVSIVALKDDLTRVQKQQSPSAKAETTGIRMEKTPFSRMELCLGLGMLYPDHRVLLGELIPPEKKEYASLQELLKSNPAVPPVSIIESLDATLDIKEWLSVVLLFCEENFGQWSSSIAGREIRKLCKSTNKELLLERQRRIIVELKTARSQGRIDEESQLLTQYNQALKLAKMAS